ncbi:Transposase IS200-like domain-containing protein [Candidatus Electronema halotolerans]
MSYNPDIHHRRSIRLRGYDYSQAGVYFVTLCTHNRECLFGEIANGAMQLNAAGKIVADEWLKIAQIRDEIELDEWAVMPNHLHGIMVLTDTVGAKNFSLLQNGTSKTIGSIVRGFKIGVTKWMR